MIILVGKEELHVRRCLEKLAALAPRQVIVVESQQEDRTHDITVETARALGWSIQNIESNLHCPPPPLLSTSSPPPPLLSTSSPPPPLLSTSLSPVFHAWPGNQAAQFQWAIENLPIEAKWIFRLDADEYLTDELITEIQEKLPQLGEETAGVVLRRRHIWNGVWVKRGMYPTRILRLFRRGRGRSDGKLMDEHIVVEGKVVEFEHDFIDHSLISLEAWEAKHRNYAQREAQSFLSGEKSTGAKGRLKWCYYHLLPSFARPAIYWFRRAIVAGAFFESSAARDFTWRHAFWYRTLVEKEIKRRRGRK